MDDSTRTSFAAHGIDLLYHLLLYQASTPRIPGIRELFPSIIVQQCKARPVVPLCCTSDRLLPFCCNSERLLKVRPRGDLASRLVLAAEQRGDVNIAVGAATG
jgi:hypothetical protein